MKERALVIAPGRGTYNKEELGYFARHHANKGPMLRKIDAYREEQGQTLISELDAMERYDASIHTSGDNASPLIYACAYADFISINREKYDICAVTGNSMGWYIALALSGAVSPEGGLEIINTMGRFMHDSLIGGQVIYTLVDAQWHEIEGAHNEAMKLCKEIDGLYPSIELGGMFVFGGTENALADLNNRLEKRDIFPFRLHNHAAFHTPLQSPISQKALQHFSKDLFKSPSIDAIDGRGHIWDKVNTKPNAMFNYTFDHQITEVYDFTAAVQQSIRHSNPDKIIILGPGTTLGGAVAQSLIKMGWQGLTSKDDFTKRQKENPLVLSMGMEDQRALVI